MIALPKTIHTREEYLAMEEKSPMKHEFCHGEIFAMAGASPEHIDIATNVLRDLSLLLMGKKCRPRGSDQRVKIDETGLYAYPDATVVCGHPRYEPDVRPAVLLNPVLIVEILSSSTEAYDRGAKFAHYRRIPSLKEVLFISSEEPRVEQHVRQSDDQWLLHAEEIDLVAGNIRLTSVQGELKLATIYYGIEFPPSLEVVRENQHEHDTHSSRSGSSR